MPSRKAAAPARNFSSRVARSAAASPPVWRPDCRRWPQAVGYRPVLADVGLYSEGGLPPAPALLETAVRNLEEYATLHVAQFEDTTDRPSDLLRALQDAPEMQRRLVVAGARDEGLSWKGIANPLRMSAEDAIKRCGNPGDPEDQPDR